MNPVNPASPILLITPPMSQLNTPYPGTAYLTGFLRGQGERVAQADLSLETALALFSRGGLEALFDAIEEGLSQGAEWPEEVLAFINQRRRYEGTIDGVIRFLQGKDPTLAHRLAATGTLPEGPRFQTIADLDQAFGDMGLSDRARYICTLYIDDLADLVAGTIAPSFSLTRYGEHLASSQASFDPLAAALAAPPGFIDQLYLDALERHMAAHEPQVVGFSCPFPGNVYAALRGGGFIKANYPGVTVIMGGGYPNTELRSLAEPRVFDYVDFITLDDGEAPLMALLSHLRGERGSNSLKRTFHRVGGAVVFEDGAERGDVPHKSTGAPSYEGLPLRDYLSVLEVLNPMHRLWGEGRWNKLTLAHGCYWKKCAFCDINLDYIGRFDPAPAKELVDRMDALAESTGVTGFHFVDEAAPPHLLKELALELIRRGRFYSWWGNIRFEARFDEDLCRLLAASGAIAVSGGLEVASDRLLALMAKGVTVAQVAQVTRNFTQAGVMVHAYLMYGFPTQTAQETVDSLERVRQLFEAGVIQSGFWHRFIATIHSPIGTSPEAFGITLDPLPPGGFASNDLTHNDPQGADHEIFSDGLKKATFNYMNGQGFHLPAHSWFEERVPRSRLASDLIKAALLEPSPRDLDRQDRRALWLGAPCVMGLFEDDTRALELSSAEGEGTLYLEEDVAQWLEGALEAATPGAGPLPRLGALLKTYPGEDLEGFIEGEDWGGIRALGLILV